LLGGAAGITRASGHAPYIAGASRILLEREFSSQARICAKRAAHRAH
jgi:hypothetical protein